MTAARAFSSEVLKLRPLRRVGLLCFAAVTVLAASLTVGAAGDASVRGPGGAGSATVADITGSGGLATALAGAGGLIGVVALALAAWAFGQEYANRTLAGLLTRMPGRTSLMGGKLAAVWVLTAAGVLIACVPGAAAAVAAAVAQGHSTSEWWTTDGLADTALTALRASAVAGLWATAGACLAVLLRSPVAAIGVGLAYALPGELLLTTAIDGLREWLPGQLLGSVIAGGDATSGLGRALFLALLQIGILAAVTMTVFMRRTDDG